MRFNNDNSPTLPHFKEVQKIYQRLFTWASSNNIDSLENFKTSTSDKFLAVCLVDLMLNFEYWKPFSDDCISQGKQIFVITDSFITNLPALPGIHFFPYYQLLGADSSYNEYKLIDSPKKKLYSCFIQRVESVRQTWLYMLHDRKLLDEGYVCFLMKQLSDYSDLNEIELFDRIHQQYGLDKLPHFHESYLALRNQIPYSNFPKGSDINQLAMDSKYFLSLETYAIEDDWGTSIVYEKTLSALQFPCMPLLFCQRGTIKLLGSTGIEVPKYLLDIDDLPWQERQQKLLNILTDDQIEYNWNEVKSRAEHNRRLISLWQQTYQHPDFFNQAFEKIINA